MLDRGEDPPFLVLEHLDNDALRLSGEAKLSRSDIKFTARSTLQALSFLHAKGIAHTGMDSTP
jgi:serine/threonine protein kinase